MRNFLFPRQAGVFFLALLFMLGLAPSVARGESLSVSITSPSSGTVLTVGQPFSLSAQIGGGEPWYSYWFDTGDGSSKGSPSGSSQNVSVGYMYRNPGTYTISLSVQDKNTSGGFLSGSLSGSDSVTVTVIGVPEPATYSLVVNQGSGGGRYSAGTIVSISANPAGTGQVFDRWTGGAVTDPTSQTTTLNMPASALTVTALYKEVSVPPTPILPIITSVSPSPIIAGEMLSVNGSGFTPSGSAVSLIGGDGQKTALATTFFATNLLQARVPETVPSGTYRVTVRSAVGEGPTEVPLVVSEKPIPLPTYILSVLMSGSGAGTLSGGGISCGTDCTETVDAHTAVILTASPANGSTFTGWTGGGCSGTGLSCLLLVEDDTAVTAVFVEEVPVIVSNLFSVARPTLSNVKGSIDTRETVTSRELTISGTFTTEEDFSVPGPIEGTFQYAPATGAFVDWVHFTLPLGLKGNEKATATYSWRAGGGKWRFRLCVANECGEELSVTLAPTSGSEEATTNTDIVPGSVSRLSPVGLSWEGVRTQTGKLKAGTMKVSADIVNLGGTLSEISTGRFEYSHDGKSFAPWVNFSVPALNPGAKSKISFTWEGGVGVWFLRACVGQDICSDASREEVVSATQP